MMKHNFDELIDRKGTECKKWDTYADDVIPMWIADTDFKCPQPVVDAMVKRAQHGIFGYPVNVVNFEESIVNWQKKRFGWNIETDWWSIRQRSFRRSYTPCAPLPNPATMW